MKRRVKKVWFFLMLVSGLSLVLLFSEMVGDLNASDYNALDSQKEIELNDIEDRPMDINSELVVVVKIINILSKLTT